MVSCSADIAAAKDLSDAELVLYSKRLNSLDVAGTTVVVVALQVTTVKYPSSLALILNLQATQEEKFINHRIIVSLRKRCASILSFTVHSLWKTYGRKLLSVSVELY